MKKAILLIYCLVLTILAKAQQPKLDWTKYIGSSGNQWAYSIVADLSGNVYVTGFFCEKVDFDPGFGEFYLTAVDLDELNRINGDIFILKLDAFGNFVWAKQIGQANHDVGNSITLDKFGNVYVTGSFEGKVDFDPGPGIFNLNSAENTYDAFILKLDSCGNFEWAKNMKGTRFSSSNATCIKLDSSGNIYTTGTFESTVDFDPGPGEFTLTATGLHRDIFISKLNSSGNFIWAQGMGGIEDDYGLSIALDGIGNIYTTGFFSGVADFDPSTVIFNLTSLVGSSDIFISKLNTNGTFMWAKNLGGNDRDAGSSISLDIYGNLYISGNFNGTVDFDPGSGIYNLKSNGYSDIFVSKFNASGNFIWVKSIGGSLDDYAVSTVLDILGNVYLTGVFKGTIDFDPGPDTFNLTSSTVTDMFISKLDAFGNFIWADKMGRNLEYNSRSIALDPSGNIYTTGLFRGTTGSYDIFINKMTTKSMGIYDNQNLLIYPNPSHDQFNIVVLIPTCKFINVTIEIYSLVGALVHKETTLKQGNTIDLSDQPSGLYFVRVMQGNHIFDSQRIIKL